MHEVKVSDLRNHLPKYLARAEGGEKILITRRGRVVARLVAAASDKRADAKEQLTALRAKAWVDDVSPIDVDWDAAQ